MEPPKTVAVLTRAPSSGGKSRLFAELGIPPDAALLEALLLDTVDVLRRCDVKVVAAVTPAAACSEVAALLPAGVDVIPQPPGDLGDRMAGVLGTVLAAGKGRVALVGSDLPTLAAAALTEAFERLGSEPDSVVLGPAEDGGYYLVAATRVPRRLFEGIPWGKPDVLERTRAAARGAGVRIALIQTGRDVDSVADLRACAHSHPHTRTAAWVQARWDTLSL